MGAQEPLGRRVRGVWMQGAAFARVGGLSCRGFGVGLRFVVLECRN